MAEDKVSSIYQKALERGVLKKGMTEQMFREQTATDDGLRSFYNYATKKGMRFHEYEEFAKRFRGKTDDSSQNESVAQPTPQNPTVKDNPAPTTEEEYQANPQRQWSTQDIDPALQNINVVQEQPRQHKPSLWQRMMSGFTATPEAQIGEALLQQSADERKEKEQAEADARYQRYLDYVNSQKKTKEVANPIQNGADMFAHMGITPKENPTAPTAQQMAANRQKWQQEQYDRRYLNKDGKPKDSFLKDLFENWQAGVGEIALTPYKAVETLENFSMDMIENGIFGHNYAHGTGSATRFMNEVLGGYYLRSRVEHYRKESDRYQDEQGIIESALEGDLGKAAGKAVLGTIQSAPNLAVSIYTGKKGMETLGGTFLGVTAALQKYDEIKDREDLNAAAKAVDIFGAFVSECVPEIIGAKRYGKMFNRQTVGEIRRQVQKETLNAWDKFVQSKFAKTLGKGWDKVMDWFGEGLTEGLTDVMNLTIDRALGVKDEVTQSDILGIGDSFIIGQLSDLPMQGVHRYQRADYRDKVKQEIEQNPNLNRVATEQKTDATTLANIAAKAVFGENLSAKEQTLFDAYQEAIAKQTNMQYGIMNLLDGAGVARGDKNANAVFVNAVEHSGKTQKEARTILEKDYEDRTEAEQQYLESLVAQMQEQKRIIDAIDNENPIYLGESELFGSMYQWARGKNKEAADFLTQTGGGYLKGVFYREGLGEVDALWGNDRAGLNKIIEKHINQYHDFESVDEAMSIIDQVVSFGEEREENDRKVIDLAPFRVVLVKSPEGTWVLSAYDFVMSEGEKQNRNNPSASTITASQTPEDEDARAVASKDIPISADKGTTNLSPTQEELINSLREQYESNKQEYPNVYGNLSFEGWLELKRNIFQKWAQEEPDQGWKEDEQRFQAAIDYLQNPPTKQQSPTAQLKDQITQEVTNFYNERTHGDGNVYPVAKAGNPDKTGYIIGNTAPVIDASGENPIITNNEVVTVKWDDGTADQVSAKNLDLTGQPHTAQDYIAQEIDARMQQHTAERMQAGENPILMHDQEGNVQGFFPIISEEGLLEDENGNQFTSEQLAEQGWQQVEQELPERPYKRPSDDDDQGGGTPPPPPASGAAPALNTPQVPQPNVQVVESTAPQAPVEPNPQTMSPQELAASAVEFMDGDKPTAKAFLQAELDKAKKAAAAANKQKVRNYTNIADFKRQNDALNEQKRQANDLVKKLESALIEANSYKTAEEQAAAAAEAQRQAEIRAQRRQTEAGISTSTAPAEKYKRAKKYYGNEIIITTPTGKQLRARYVLHEMQGVLTPSHDPFNNFEMSEGYPQLANGQSTNTRNYKDPEEGTKIFEIARTYDGRGWTDMIIHDGEGKVASGNGREQAAEVAARNGTDGNYQPVLRTNISSTGIDPIHADEFEHPHVTLELLDPFEFTPSNLDMFNAQSTQTNSNTSAAAKYTRALTPQAISEVIAATQEFGTMDAFLNDDKAPFALINKLIENDILTERDRASLIDGDVLSGKGRDLLKNITLGTVLDPEIIQLLGDNAQLKNSILRAIPQMLDNKSLQEYALTDDINNAIRALYDMRNRKMSFADYTRQLDMETGKPMSADYAPFALLLAEEMQEGGVDAFRNVLTAYNENAKLAQGGQIDMFTGKPHTIDELKNQILTRYGKQTEDATTEQPAKDEPNAPVVAVSRPADSEIQSADDGTPTSDEQVTEQPATETPQTPPAPQVVMWEDSPVGIQYRRLKEQYPDVLLLFRVGDFYETYEQDAQEASKILGIGLTTNKRYGNVQLAGFPFHALDSYLPKLVAAGKRIAICDQLEDPKQAKNLVKRGVTELVSAGRNATPAEQSEKPTFIDAVRTLVEKGKDFASKLFQRSYFDVAQTPDFMKELGVSGEKFTIAYGTISRHFGKDAEHGLTEAEWQQLPNAIQHPFAITKYFNNKAHTSQRGYRLYTIIPKGNGFVVVGVDVKKVNQGKDKPVLEINSISTVFGKDGAITELEEEIYRSENITPEQQSLLEKPNSSQYPAEREQNSDGKGTTNFANLQTGSEKNVEIVRLADVEVGRKDYDDAIVRTATKAIHTKGVLAKFYKADNKDYIDKSLNNFLSAQLQYEAKEEAKVNPNGIFNQLNNAFQKNIYARQKIVNSVFDNILERLKNSGDAGKIPLLKEAKTEPTQYEKFLNWVEENVSEGKTAADQIRKFVENSPEIENIYALFGKNNQFIGVAKSRLEAMQRRGVENFDTIKVDRKPKADQQQPKEEPKQEESKSENKNRVFTDEAYERAKRIMREHLNRLNAGFDPELLAAQFTIAGYHIESGARKFADFARELIKVFGDGIRKYLKPMYNNLRDVPEGEPYRKDMDDYNAVMAFDIDNFRVEEEKPTAQTPAIKVGDKVRYKGRDREYDAVVSDVNKDGTYNLEYPNALGINTVLVNIPAEQVLPTKNNSVPLQGEQKPTIEPAPTEDNLNRVIRHIGEITKSKHTQTGEDLWIVKPTDRVSDAEFKQLKARARENGGYYSSFSKNRGFIFKSEQDANNFNNIEDEQTTDQTAANTNAIAVEGQTVAAEAAAIEPDRGGKSVTQRELGTESDAPSVGAVGTVEEKTPEEREQTIVTAQQTIDKIDKAVEKHDEQLALLGYYEADKTGDFHETYGYRKSAENKAIADADRLAKQLAADLGIEVNKRKKLATANIPPAGGDITFRLPLNEGRELYFKINVNPNWDGNWYRDTGNSDDLAIDHIMWRVEDPNATGSARYGENHPIGLLRLHNNTPLQVTYAKVLRDIRMYARNYLPQVVVAPNTTRKQIIEQAAEKQKKRKNDKNAIQDNQPMLDLFGNVVEEINEAKAEESTPEQDLQDIIDMYNNDVKEMGHPEAAITHNGQTRTAEEMAKSFDLGIGDKVLYKGQEVEIVDFEKDGRPVLNSFGTNWITEIADWEDIKPTNTQDNGNETNTAREGTSGATQRKPTMAAVGVDGTRTDGGVQASNNQTPNRGQQPTELVGGQSAEGRGQETIPTQRGVSGERGERHPASRPNRGVSNTLRVEDPYKEPTDERTDNHSPLTPKEKATPKNTRNYLYPQDAGNIDSMTPAERMRTNVEALDVLRMLIRDGREATPEERAIMGKLRGWGGVNVPDNYTVKYRPHELNAEQRKLVEIINELDPSGELKLIDSLRQASHTAYYTPIPVAKAMHAIAEAAGYKGGGNMLDPSMGNGVFEGTMKKAIQQTSQIRGVELDWLTGQIAQRLYPDARISITGYQDAHIPENYYDYVISNIPFGSLQIKDLEWEKNQTPIRKTAQNRIHNYFAVKMIESTRPGGLCVIMSSNAIMDTKGNAPIRNYIVDNCEILGAVRLPKNTFKGAGTQPVTDVIFLRKFKDSEDRQRIKGNFGYALQVEGAFCTTTAQSLDDKRGDTHEVEYSDYYFTHPLNVIGTPIAGGQYSDDAYDLDSNFTVDEIARQIESIGDRFLGERKNRFGTDILNTTTPKAQIVEAVREAYKGNGSYEGAGNIVIQDGKIGKLETIKEGNSKRLVFVEQKFAGTSTQQIQDYIKLRTALKQLITAQIENWSESEINDVRKQLQQAYTAYTQRYGKLHNKRSNFTDDDMDGFQVRALEQYKDGKFVGMADIYTKNTISAERDIDDVSDPQNAVLNSLAEYGNLNNEYLERVLGKDWAEQCGNLVFENPSYEGTYIPRDQYLSGDVVSKLEQARMMAAEDKKWQRNVDALEQVQPQRKEFGQFPCHMGARWIPVEIYNDFLRDVFDIHAGWRGQKTGITYVEGTCEYVFNFDESEFGGASANYKTSKKKASEIFEAALQDKDITIRLKDSDGKDIGIDQEATDAARDKVAELRDAFEDWIPKSQERVNRLTDAYNGIFNRHVLPHYDGQHLNIVGLQGMTLLPHQKDAVWRIINQRGGIVDHIVGAGKTLVMQASIMEMRRMGIAKKPMIIAFKSTVQQIANEFRQAFPAARILAPTEKDFSVKNRKTFLSNIALNDYDCIILSHEQYTALDHLDRIKRAFVEDQISQIDNLLEYLYGTTEQSQLTKKQAKGLEKRKANLQERLKALELIKTDEEFVFENLGVDYLFVDECQAFKNLMFQTSYSNIAGLGNPAGSERSTKLLYGIRSLQELHQGDMGTIFLSGTTITNSLSELYNIFNYLRPNEMRRMGLNTFDAWASTFAVRSREAEFDATNQLKEKNRFRKFEGLQELSRLYTEISDVRNDSNLELPKPKLRTHFVAIPISETMQKINDALIRLVQNHERGFFGIELGDTPEAKYPWFLIQTNLAKLATLSPKLIDPKYDDENGKIAHLCENVAKIYDQFKEQKGVQLIFCDAGVPDKDKPYDAYNDIITRLTEQYGIPRSEIADIHIASDDNKRQALFKKVNDGEVRVLIGGTKNMGTGVNVQKRVVAMHHLDIPWTPADVAQRNGRGSRQGNEVARDFNDNGVDAYYYAVERTLDTYRYQLQDVKGKMIDNFKNANVGVDEFDEGGDDSVSPAEMVAILSGNPVILDKNKQDRLVDKLKRLQRSSLLEYNRRKQEFQELQVRKANMERLVKQNAEDVAELQRNGFAPNAKGEYPPLQVTIVPNEYSTTGATYNKAGEAGKAIYDQVNKTGTCYLYAYGVKAKVTNALEEGSFNVFTKVVEVTNLSGIKYSVKLSNSDAVAGQAMQNLLKKIWENGEKYQQRLDEINHKLDGADPGEYTFAKQAELDEALRRKREIDAEYNKLVVTDKSNKPTDTPEAMYDELDYDPDNLTPAEQLGTDDVVESLKQTTGLDLNIATEEEVAAQKKSLLETATWSELMVRANKAADISTNDGAKILQKIETSKRKIENLSIKSIKHPVSFISDVLELQQSSSSYYGTYQTKQGGIVTLRVSNHNATVSNFDNVGEQEGVSVVISNRPSNGIINDGNAHLVEYFYRKADILKAEGNPIAEILGSIKGLLETGEYHDTTGLAQVQEVNPPAELQSTEFSIRKAPAPKKTGIGYKVFYRGKDGKLYPPMVANPNGADTPIGVWLDADAAPIAGESKTGRPQVKAGGKGTQGGSGQLAYRPGWHLGEIPYALQFNRKDAEGNKTLFPKDFVWAEVEYAEDNDYQQEAEQEGITENGKYRHSYAGLKRVPENGFYRYRTNPNPDTDPWIITGAMKVNRVLSNEEVDEIVRRAGREPQQREMMQGGGKLYGWAVGNRIYLTKDGLNPNSPIHEYSHLWVKAIQKNNPELYKNLQDLFSRKNLPQMYEELDNDPNYAGLSEEGKLSEVISRFSGKRGAKRMTEEAQRMLDDAAQKGSRKEVVKAATLIQRMKQLLKDFWNWVGEHLFNIKSFGSREEAADRILYDLLNQTDLKLDNSDKRVERQAAPTTPPQTNMDEFREVIRMERDSMLEGDLLKRFDEEFGMRRAIIEKASLKQAWNERDRLIEKLYQDFADKFSAIERFQDWVRKEGGQWDENTMDAHGDVSLSRGRIDTAYKYFERDLLEHIWTAIRDINQKTETAAQEGDTTGIGHLNGLDLKWQNVESKTDNGRQLTVREIMGVYAQAKDAEEAEQQGLADRGAMGFINNLGVTYTQVINAVESRLTPEQINAFWTAVKEANQYALDYQLKGGLITPEQRAEYNRQYYVPQRGWRERDFDGVETQYVKGDTDRLYDNPYNPALIRARGRTSLASDPFAYIESIGKTSIMTAEHNMVKQKFLELVLANDELGKRSGAWHAYQIYAKNEIDPATGRIRLDANGNPVPPTAVSASPTQEERKHDEQLLKEIEQLKKERRKLIQTYAQERKDKEINDKVNQLYYAGRVTDSMLSQRTNSEKRQHRVVVLKDGRQYVIELRNEELANAVNGNFESHIAECLRAGGDIKLFRKLTHGYAAMMTQYSPRFAHRNFWRDLQAAIINNAHEQGRKFTVKAVFNIPKVQKAVWQYISNDMFRDKTAYDESTEFGRYMKEYFENGAQTGFSFMQDMQEMAKEVDKRIKGDTKGRKVLDFCKAIASCLTEASELTVRFAQYATARQFGYSEAAAAKMAKNITVNFDQSGLISKELSRYFIFFNASIQGNIRFAQPQGKARPTAGRMAKGFFKKALGHIFKVGAMFAVVGYLANLLQPDDPDDEVWFTDYDRMSYFIIGKWKILPVVHFYRMFWAAGAQAALATQGRKTWTDAFSTASEYALSEIVPTSIFQVHNLFDYNDDTNEIEFNPKKYAQGAMPSVISPITDVWLNYDYRGLPVYYENRYKENQKNISKAKRNTPALYTVPAEALHFLSGGDPRNTNKGGVTDGWIDLNPSGMQHIVEGYLPSAISSVIQFGVGTYKLFAGDLNKNDIVFFRDLQRDWQIEQSYKSEYYKLRGKLEAYEQTCKGMTSKQLSMEKQTDRFKAYESAKRTLNGSTTPKYGEEQTFTANEVKALMDANKTVNKNIFDTGFFEGFKYNTSN